MQGQEEAAVLEQWELEAWWTYAKGSGTMEEMQPFPGTTVRKRERGIEHVT